MSSVPGTQSGTSGSKHNIWTTQLALFDLGSNKDTEVTTGSVLNDYLSFCGN